MASDRRSLPAPPTELAGFEILRRLGAGGMAEVFLAKKRGAEGTFKLLVVKRILPAYATSRRFRQMFVEEANLATRLNHPNIVQVYEFSDHGDEGLLLSMEYVEGCDLGRLMSSARAKSTRVPPYIGAYIIAEAARGLHYAHERRDEGDVPLAIVHRDVSPQNILVSYDGVVKIADFGIASANLFREEPGTLKGKFGYMSPEQARGEKVDRRSDIYALGVVFYELLAQRSPYARPGSGADAARRHGVASDLDVGAPDRLRRPAPQTPELDVGAPDRLRRPAPQAPELDDDALLAAVRAPVIEPPSAHAADIPPDLEAIVIRALAKSPGDRFQTARDMAAAISRAFMARQELVDHTSLEATLEKLVGRDGGAGALQPNVREAKDEPLTLAAVPAPRGSDVSDVELERVVHEVRHVAVITLRIDGLQDLSNAVGAVSARRQLDAIRSILDDIAYKRGAVWSWDGVETARAVVGLLSNPSRAAAQSAFLAIDVHEALKGASEDLPVALRASIGIVRGIASGERDAEGHLQHHLLQRPAGYLADELGSRTPFGKTWVAGGVYRVVRRDFRWAEAPGLDLRGSAEPVPPQMRVYALVRPLTREERAAELALLPNDLVGRDAEKADLAAAFHATLSIGTGPISAAKRSSPRRESDAPSAPKVPGRPSRPPPPAIISDLPPPTFASLVSARAGAGLDLSALDDVAEEPLPLSSDPRAALGDGGDARPSPGALRDSDTPPSEAQRRSSRDPGPIRDEARASFAPRSAAGPSSRGAGPALSSPGGQIVVRVVSGEMGIGKSALVSTFLSELPPVSRALTIECSPVRSELPFASAADLVRAATGLGIDHNVADAKNVIMGLLSPVSSRLHDAGQIATRLAELATGKNEGPSEEEAAGYRRELLVTGLRHLFVALARTQPLVIVVDSLQWADRPSLDLWAELTRRPDPVPILYLFVTRPDERVTAFVAQFVQIELRGLSPEEQMRLVEARLGVRRGVAAVCGELVPKVAGNPFFLLEMIDALLERGTLEIAERPDGDHELLRHERSGEKDSLPTTLEQLIGDRLRELPPAERDIVSWLAVAGGPLAEQDLLHLTRLTDDEAVTRLCARGLVDRKTGSVDFRHPLVRDVAYLAMDPPLQIRAHRILGEHLAATPLGRGLSAAIVAGHLARGESESAAADHYLEAASAGRSAHHAQLAQRYYELALSLLPSGDHARRLVAHEGLEAVFRHLGRRKERRRHLTELRRLARASGSARWACIALVRTARLDLDDGYYARGLPIAERTTDLARVVGRPSLEVEALLLFSETLRSLGDIQGALNACERALHVTEQGRLPARSRAEVLRTKGVLLRWVGRVREAVEAYAEAIAVFKKVGARRSEARAKNALAYAMFVLERFEDAIAVAHASVAIDLAIGGRFQIAKTLSNIGQAYARLGDLEQSLVYMRRAREAHERYGDQDSRADTLLAFASILLETGDVDTAQTLVGDAGALVAVTGSMYDAVHERILRALVARARGEADAAVSHAAEARRLAEAQGLLSYHIYAQAIEGAARIDAGELHTGVLLARTALGAIEASEASEFGIEVRALAIEALRRGTPTSARDAVERAAHHVRAVARHIRSDALRALFLQRPVVERLLLEEREILAETGSSAWGSGASAAPAAPPPEPRRTTGITQP